MLKSQTTTNGWQDVYVERNHNQQETSEKQKRDFISERLVEPPSDWRPHDEPESCENLQTTLKRENSSTIKYFIYINSAGSLQARRIRSFLQTVNQRLFIIFHGIGRNGKTTRTIMLFLSAHDSNGQTTCLLTGLHSPAQSPHCLGIFLLSWRKWRSSQRQSPARQSTAQ